MTENVVNLNEQ